MSEVKHTPGPWGLSDDGQWIQAKGGKSPMVGDRFFSICVSATSEEDKRLIAAAPDLLEALESLIIKYVRLVNSGDAGFWNPEDDKEVIAAIAAIAKAEGRS